MKKFLILGLSLILLSAVASAQQADGRHLRRNHLTQNFRNDELNRPERHQLRRDHFRYRVMQHRARRDGYVGSIERRHLHRMRKHNRMEAYRFRHNRFHRVI